MSIHMSIHRVALVQGKFPDFLVEAWDDYDFRKDSDNDRPGVLTVLFNVSVFVGVYSLLSSFGACPQVGVTSRCVFV